MKKKDWYDWLHSWKEPDKELPIEEGWVDADDKPVRKPRHGAVEVDLEAAMTMVEQLEDDIETLHERYTESRREVTKLKHAVKSKDTVLARMQGLITERDKEIGSLKHHIHSLKVQLSPDQVLHKRILPELKLKRHSHKPSNPDYGDL